MLGQYVKFKGEYYIIVEELKDGTEVKLLDPRRGNYKIKCKVSNIELTPNICKRVLVKGSQYLVTKNKYIVSLATGRVVQWNDSSSSRKAILALAQSTNS